VKTDTGCLSPGQGSIVVPEDSRRAVFLRPEKWRTGTLPLPRFAKGIRWNLDDFCAYPVRHTVLPIWNVFSSLFWNSEGFHGTNWKQHKQLQCYGVDSVS
jgi:hypothetical protein